MSDFGENSPLRAYATKLSLTNENRTYLDHKMIASKRITHYSTGFAHIVILIMSN